MRKFTKLMLTLSLLTGAVGGASSVSAQNLRAYSTGISDSNSNISYNEGTKTWTWTTTSANQLTIFSFTAGTLSKFSTINWESSGSTIESEKAKYRVIFYAGSTSVKAFSPYSDGTKNLNISDYLTDEQAATITAIKFSGSGDGTGSTVVDLDGIYLAANHGIGTTEDWETLSAVVNAGLTKVNVSMTADVDAGSTMVGTSTNKYQGTFDGAGHTLTFNCTNTDGSTGLRIAPFSYTNNATVKNLFTTGSVEAFNLPAGLIGDAYGTTTISNCSSNMSLKGTRTSDCTVGGLVARCSDATSTTFNYCVFNGSLDANTSIQACGLAGWQKSCPVTANYCLIAPTSVKGGHCTVAATRGGATAPTVNNTYYIGSNFANNQGTAATAVQLASGSLAYDLNTDNTGTLFFGQANLNRSNIGMPLLTSDVSKKVVKLTPQSVSTALYANPGGAAPNPVRYSALGFRLQGSSDNPSLAVLPSDITDATVLVRRYDQYTLAVSAAGATTLVLPFDAELPEGVKAYSLTYTSGDEVTATPVNQIKANKPVLLNADEGSYTFVVSNSSAITYSSETITSGALSGVYVQAGSSAAYNPVAYVPADSYVLQNGTNGIGFYKVADANTVRITSFRAYLTAQTGARALKIVYADDDPTGINAVQGEKGAADVYYDLQGRRVAQPTKGLYIVNGKKVILK